MCLSLGFSMLYISFLAIFSSAWTFSLPPPFDIRLDHYKVDTTRDLVINKPRPEFSWKIPVLSRRSIHQLAYQIQIQSRENQWDSDRVLSNRSIHVQCLRQNFNRRLIIDFVFEYGSVDRINRVSGPNGLDFERRYLVCMSI